MTSRQTARKSSPDIVSEAPIVERPFAGLCRSLRRERGLMLRNQAEHFRVSVAYVSAVETGRKGQISCAFVEDFIEWMSLDEITAERLRRAADDGQTTVTLKSKSTEQARLLATLGRALDTISPADIEALRQRVVDLRRNKAREPNGRLE
jgi:transcriptional regulator with XRE-family HTH domain